jgi:hypothetical protein
VVPYRPLSSAVPTYWPPNRGFLGTPTTEVLPVGTRLDRYGYDTGTFLAPVGIPPHMRSLEPGRVSQPPGALRLQVIAVGAGNGYCPAGVEAIKDAGGLATGRRQQPWWIRD